MINIYLPTKTEHTMIIFRSSFENPDRKVKYNYTEKYLILYILNLQTYLRYVSESYLL